MKNNSTIKKKGQYFKEHFRNDFESTLKSKTSKKASKSNKITELNQTIKDMNQQYATKLENLERKLKDLNWQKKEQAVQLKAQIKQEKIDSGKLLITQLENSQYQQDLQFILQQVHNLKQKNLSEKEVNQKLEQDMQEEYQQKIIKLMKEIGNLTEECDRLQDIHSDNKQLKVVVNLLKEQLSQQQLNNSHLRSKNAQIAVNLDDIKKQQLSFQERERKKQSEIQDLQKNISELKMQKEHELRLKEECNKEESQSLKKQMSQIIQSRDSLIDKLQSNLMQQRVQNIKMKDSLNCVSYENQRLKVCEIDKSYQIQSQHQKIQSIERERERQLRELTLQRCRSMELLQSQRSQAENYYKGEIAKLEQQVGNDDKELDRAQREIARLDNRSSQLQTMYQKERDNSVKSKIQYEKQIEFQDKNYRSLLQNQKQEMDRSIQNLEQSNSFWQEQLHQTEQRGRQNRMMLEQRVESSLQQSNKNLCKYKLQSRINKLDNNYYEERLGQVERHFSKEVEEGKKIQNHLTKELSRKNGELLNEYYGHQQLSDKITGLQEKFQNQSQQIESMETASSVLFRHSQQQTEDKDSQIYSLNNSLKKERQHLYGIINSQSNKSSKFSEEPYF